MRIRIRPKSSIEEYHANKKNKFLIRIRKKSDVIRRQQISSQREKEAQAIKQAHLENGNGKVNRAGNKRGLYRQDMSPEDLSEDMKKRRAMRRFYNKQMPVPQCNGCAFAAQCPQFKAGYECAFLPFLNSHKVESVDDLIIYMREMIGAGVRRTHWALTAETLSGGTPSFETTEQMAMLFNQLKELYQIATKQDTEIEIEGDASIIGQLFGGLGQLVEDTKLAHAKPINVKPVIRETAPLLMDKEAVPADMDVGLFQEFSKNEVLRRHTGKENPVVTVTEAK